MNRRRIVVVGPARNSQSVVGNDEGNAFLALRFYLRQNDSEVRKDPWLGIFFDGEVKVESPHIQAIANALSDFGYEGVLVKELLRD